MHKIVEEVVGEVLNDRNTINHYHQHLLGDDVFHLYKAKFGNLSNTFHPKSTNIMCFAHCFSLFSSWLSNISFSWIIVPFLIVSANGWLTMLIFFACMRIFGLGATKTRPQLVSRIWGLLGAMLTSTALTSKLKNSACHHQLRVRSRGFERVSQRLQW